MSLIVPFRTSHAQPPCRYDPINFVDKWSTPMLVIHGSKDYRLPETDGIGAFHALQQCVLSVAEFRVICTDACLQARYPEPLGDLPG